MGSVVSRVAHQWSAEVPSDGDRIQAAYLIFDVLAAAFNKFTKMQLMLIRLCSLLSILTQYILNMIISTCNQ